jgi:hypothetical protein
VRRIARATHLPPTTVYRRLRDTLGFTVRHLRWVPHILSDQQKQRRVECSRELLTLLESQQRRDWQDIVTLDESWFYFTTDHEQIWLPSEGRVPERERKMIQSPKLMLTIAWNPAGFHVIAFLPKGCKFNAQYYISEVLDPLVQWHRTRGRGRSNQILTVHADNARLTRRLL